MGVATTEPLTTTVTWTQFPAEALSDVDWTDHQQAHRGVMRLFPRDLGGDPGRRRETAGVLFRIDVIGGIPTVLVQSKMTPEIAPPGARMMTVNPGRFAAGDRVTFRVKLNPVRRTTVYFTDQTRTKRVSDDDRSARAAVRLANGRRDRSNIQQHASVVPAEQLVDWLVDKLSPALSGIDVLNVTRDQSHPAGGRGRGRGWKLVGYTFDGVATVADQADLAGLCVEGVGRGRAYGCGLLTVAPTR